MKVILLEKIRRLGNFGDIVDVKPGYARNYLVPSEKAAFATADKIAYFEKRRHELEKKAQETLAQAEARAAKMNNITLVISAMASDEGKLYGSVSANEIKDALLAQSIEVEKREIVMPNGPIHSIGDYSVEIHVHSDVVAVVPVQVVSAK